MAKRLQSPSSINTFKQCQRKYYYQYIEKLPTKPSIHLVRGNIVHSTLEDFYDIDVSSFTKENYSLKFKEAIQRLLFFQWKQYHEKLNELNLSQDQLKFYFEESMLMTLNWHNQFLRDFNKKLESNGHSILQAFQDLTPVRELEYRSEEKQVRGFIDAIHHFGDEVHIVDYKTNARSDLKDSIMLQLSIYAMMHQEKHGKIPEKVGAFFLRDCLKMVSATEEMVQNAKAQVEMIHAHTELTDNITD